MKRVIVCVVLGWAAGSCGMDSDEVDELQAMAVARSQDERSDIQKLYDLIDQAGRLRDRPGVSEVERAALDAAASAARDAIAAYVDKHGQGQTRAVVLGRLGQASGAILADDVTGIGVSDNWLLVLCALTAVATVVLAEAQASRTEIDMAWERVGNRLSDLNTAVAAAMATVAAIRAPAEQCKKPRAGDPAPAQPAGRSSVDVAPAPDMSEPDRGRRDMCETAFPEVAECWSLPDDYVHRSAEAALRDMKVSTGNHSLKLHSPDETQTGPCPEKGLHHNVRAGSERAGSIVCCPCCSDNLRGPAKEERCRIVW